MFILVHQLTLVAQKLSLEKLEQRLSMIIQMLIWLQKHQKILLMILVEVFTLTDTETSGGTTLDSYELTRIR